MPPGWVWRSLPRRWISHWYRLHWLYRENSPLPWNRRTGLFRKPSATLTFHSGFFQGSAYSGEVSTLEGELPLPPLLSAALLEGPFIVLALRNEGPDVRLGLDPYVLRQDLYAGLSGGPLSVGAVPVSGRSGRAGRPFDASGASDERCGYGGGTGARDGGATFGWRSTALCASGATDENLPQARCTALKINHLHPLIHSDTI